eukprot:TRINITY_DN12643_c0_g2_i2.p1 TRINITY_DN12643_c0_g2~~TRINITY_DN12643_c0_g2_i2.p1  ORF type:complete len:151 (+),score=30.75 TRINITY_DN12643_c0_g2_i2:157-609(+)
MSKTDIEIAANVVMEIDKKASTTYVPMHSSPRETFKSSGKKEIKGKLKEKAMRSTVTTPVRGIGKVGIPRCNSASNAHLVRRNKPTPSLGIAYVNKRKVSNDSGVLNKEINELIKKQKENLKLDFERAKYIEVRQKVFRNIPRSASVYDK